MTFIRKLGIVFLVAYSTWLTSEKIELIGYNRGLQIGYETGIKTGYKEGRGSVCMIKPI